jgi:hypothetical protein
MARRLKKANREDRSRLQSQRGRKESLRNQRSLFIITCEGENTERLYFESWFARLRESKQLSSRSCVIASHSHTNPSGVLADLLAFQDGGLTFKDFEHRWIVIDRDSERTNGGGHTLADFNTALQQARQKRPKVSVAWSNPCFELWYLLHFRYQNTGTDRVQIQGQLSNALGLKYDKSDPNLFILIIANLPDALRNAKRLHTDFQEQGLSADKSNPCTTVYQLVELLEGMAHTGAETKEQV